MQQRTKSGAKYSAEGERVQTFNSTDTDTGELPGGHAMLSGASWSTLRAATTATSQCLLRPAPKR